MTLGSVRWRIDGHRPVRHTLATQAAYTFGIDVGARGMMTVRCEGDSWVMEQIGEKQDFEAELSRLGLRHEDFTLHVRRGRLGGLDKNWGAHYAVRVTNTVTGNRGIYLGGSGEAWVAQFAADVANGLYRNPSMMSKLPLRVRKTPRHVGS